MSARPRSISSRVVRSRAALCVALSFAIAPSAAHAWCRTTTQRAPAEVACNVNGRPLQWQGVCAGFSINVVHSTAVIDIPVEQLRMEALTAGTRWRGVPCNAMNEPPYFELRPLATVNPEDPPEAADTVTFSGYSARGPNSNTVWFNSIWRLDQHHREGTIAVTLVTFDNTTGQILDADVEMNTESADNPTGFRFTVGMPAATSADLPTILTHEFGHFLGIAHSEQMSAVMWPEAGLGEQRRDLRQDDRDAICDAYPPELTPDRSCNQVPFGGFALTPNGARVVGGCVVAPGRSSSGARTIAWAAILGGMWIARRRGERTPRS